MKKMLSICILAVVISASAISTNASCPQGDKPCNGVCVGVYSAGGEISHYTCSSGATAAPKDCTGAAFGQEEDANF
ncbi:MAG: hypothetical protein ABL929_12445 [Ferruginibacter sp.]|nr:hypothetical protein [Ferruginibacter sp.]